MTSRQVAAEFLTRLESRPEGFKFVDAGNRVWDSKAYCEMLARTTLLNTSRQEYLNTCAENGADVVCVTVSGHCCDKCAVWENRLLSISGTTKGLPTVDDAMAAGLFHPNCTHSLSEVDDYTREEEYNPDGTPKNGEEKEDEVDYAKQSGSPTGSGEQYRASRASVEFTQKHIAENVDATGLSTQALDAINTHMAAAMEKYGLDKWPGLEPTNDQTGIIGVDRATGIFRFNAQAWNEIVKNPREAFVRFVKTPEKFEGRKRFAIESKNQVIKHFIDHEVGHRLFNDSTLQDKETRLEELWKQHKADKVFGSYAAASSREFFSEAFAIRERGGILSADISAFIDEVVK